MDKADLSFSFQDGYSFGEAFWCAVVSVTVAGSISLALIFHYLLGYEAEGEDAVEVRMEGRKFMLSVTVFMVILGFQALAFSRLEAWSYSDAICELAFRITQHQRISC